MLCLEQVLLGYGRPFFAGCETSRCRAMDIVFDFAVGGKKLFGGGGLKTETCTQRIAGNQTDDEAFRSRRIDMPASKFYALRCGIENRDRIECQRHFCSRRC